MGITVLLGSIPLRSRSVSSLTGSLASVSFLLTMFVWTPPASARSRITFPYSPCTEKSKLPGCVSKRLSKDLVDYTPKQYPDHGLADAMSEQGKQARGFYITPMYLRSLGPERTAAAMKRGRLDTVVIDMKDDLGHLTYPSKVPLGKTQVRVLIRDPEEMVKTFHAQGIYVIARIVTFKDSRLPYVRPDLAVRIGANAHRLYATGENWLDAYSAEVQDYVLDVALELQSFGFDEIQFDYIRFPRGAASEHGIWLHAGDKPASHATVIANFLEKVDRALTVPISADVFGLTTLVDGDPRGLGQDIERMAKYIEAISPMMYANGMDTYFRNRHITTHVIDIIQCGLQRARKKTGDIVLRPYLQAYSNGVEHMWGPEFVLDQVRAALNAGSEGYLFWNPTMKNHIIMQAMREFAAGRGGTLMSSKRLKRTEIRAAWCPMGGNVFGTAAEREKRAKGKKRSTTARSDPAQKSTSVRCRGACVGTP